MQIKESLTITLTKVEARQIAHEILRTADSFNDGPLGCHFLDNSEKLAHAIYEQIREQYVD